MKCEEYAPLVSRYLDEDLEGRELETLLDHLSSCEECNEEMAGIDRLRGWLQAADAHQGIPEIRGAWGLDDLLKLEGATASIDPSETPSSIGVREAAKEQGEGSRGMSWIRRTLFPFPLVPRQAMQFALPLLLVALAATWYYTQYFTEQMSDWVDVTELESSPTETVSFPQEEGDEIDYYVVQHATHQPWEQYGDEVPMLQLASMPAR